MFCWRCGRVSRNGCNNSILLATTIMVRFWTDVVGLDAQSVRQLTRGLALPDVVIVSNQGNKIGAALSRCKIFPDPGPDIDLKTARSAIVTPWIFNYVFVPAELPARKQALNKFAPITKGCGINAPKINCSSRLHTLYLLCVTFSLIRPLIPAAFFFSCC
jgi:hypothetical protein